MRAPNILLMPYLVVVALIAVTGCFADKGAYRTASVKGSLTCEGKPVANVLVMFVPQAGEGRSAAEPGKPAQGITDENGKFTLTTYEEGDGAIVGTHLVRIQPAPGGKPGPPVPCRENTVKVNVEPGENKLTVEL